MRTQLSRIRLVWVIALVASMTTVPALAGEKNKPGTKPDKSKQIAALVNKPEVLYGNEFDMRSLSREERHVLGVYRYEFHTHLLHEAMVRELKLTDLQKTVISGIIEDQIAYLHETGGVPPMDTIPNPDAEPGARVATPAMGGPPPPSLRNAKGALGSDGGSKRPPATMFDDPTPFIDVLKGELSGEQIPQFVELSYRWKIVRPTGVADGPLRQLVRAVKDPALDVEAGQRVLFEQVIRRRMIKLGRDRRFVDKRLKAFDDAKAEIEASLTQPQREHFEKTLTLLREWYAEEILMLKGMRAKEKSAAEKDAKTAEPEKPEPKKP